MLTLRGDVAYREALAGLEEREILQHRVETEETSVLVQVQVTYVLFVGPKVAWIRSRAAVVDNVDGVSCATASTR